MAVLNRPFLLAAAALAVALIVILVVFLGGGEKDDVIGDVGTSNLTQVKPGRGNELSSECFQLRLLLRFDLPGLTDEERSQIVAQLNDDSYLDGTVIKKDMPPINFKKWNIPDENVAAPAFIASTDDGHSVALVEDLQYAGVPGEHWVILDKKVTDTPNAFTSDRWAQVFCYKRRVGSETCPSDGEWVLGTPLLFAESMANDQAQSLHPRGGTASKVATMSITSVRTNCP